jgi:hypothetical protein
MREQFQKEADATRGVCIYLESIDTTLRHVRTFFYVTKHALKTIGKLNPCLIIRLLGYIKNLTPCFLNRQDINCASSMGYRSGNNRF